MWPTPVSTSCDLQIIKLSDAVQELPRSVTEFVHGVPESFLKVGEAKAKAPEAGQPRFSKGAYFIGKVCAGARGSGLPLPPSLACRRALVVLCAPVLQQAPACKYWPALQHRDVAWQCHPTPDKRCCHL